MAFLSSLVFACSTVSVDPAPVIDQLRQYDTLLANATVQLRITRPHLHFDATQGNQILTGTISRSADMAAMQFLVEYDTPPSYAPPGTSGYREYDYGPDGCLIHWRAIGIDTLSSPAINKSIAHNQLVEVLADGTVRKQAVVNHHYLYDVGSEDSVSLIDQTMLASGRGYSRHLKAITQVRELPDGSLEITADGTYGSQQQGIWKLTLETQHHLVRSAEFVRQNGVVVLRTTTSGIVQPGGAPRPGPLSIAERGSIEHSPGQASTLTLAVAAKSIVDGGDEKFIAETTKKIMTEPGKDDPVTDFRSK